MTSPHRCEAKQKADDQEQNENDNNDDRIEVRIDFHSASCLIPKLILSFHQPFYEYAHHNYKKDG